MKRAAFNTGKPHQAAVATWARKRLVDDGGRPFVDGTGAEDAEQVGCLFADGVGLGKTWEALAAVALLLDKRDWRKRRYRARRARSRRRRRIYHRRREAHVLILVPPGLVAKWASELGNREPDGFSSRLRRWAKQRSRGFVTSTLTESYFVIRRRADLKKLPRGSKKHGRYVLPAGTYICNWNVFLGPGGVGLDRVTALKNQHWEVVVVDEAHHGRARKALDKLQYVAETLLLTATPFQLDMTELHGLTRHLLVGKAGQHKVLARGAVREYAKAADGAFEGGDPPTRAQRTAVEGVLVQLVACSRVGRQCRHYFAIDAEGKANEITPPTDLETGDLPGIFERGIRAPGDFAEWYLGRRLELARREAGERPRHVAIELQKLLSVRKPPAPATPRLEALRRWARVQFAEDLASTLGDGLPRKLLVFTHLKTHVVGPIRQALEDELSSAHRRIARTPGWRAMRSAADKHLESVLAKVRRCVSSEGLHTLLERFAQAIHGTLFHDLFGNRKFARKAENELTRLVRDEQERATASEDADEAEFAAWYQAQHKTRARTARALLDAVARAPLAATFTGDDGRHERDAMAQAFKSVLAPWILVATNVGSEGIDLHTYSRHLVHFDLEWNPARMEQREGRIDRLGRALDEPARIYYLLVKDTYDERMFHQLIARQRWHGVLLGRKALQLGRDMTRDAKLLTRRETETMSLDLDPRRRARVD